MTQHDAESLRGSLVFASRSFDVPVRDFEGVLTDYITELMPARENFPARYRVKFKFENLKVHRSDVPWQWPHVEIPVVYQSQIWDALAGSIEALSGQPTAAAGLVGKKMRWARTPGHKGRTRNPETGNWEDTTIEAWECLHLEGVQAGVGRVDFSEVSSRAKYLATLADGRTVQEFTREALQDKAVQEHTETWRAVMDSPRLLIEEMKREGKIEEDEATGKLTAK